MNVKKDSLNGFNIHLSKDEVNLFHQLCQFAYEKISERIEKLKIVTVTKRSLNEILKFIREMKEECLKEESNGTGKR